MRPALPLALLVCCAAPAQFFAPLPGRPGGDPDQLAYDPGRDRVVALLSDATWEHDGVAWRRIVPTLLPRERYEYAIAFDGQRVLVHGGGTPIGQSPPALDDFWAWDGSVWTALSTANGPGRRRGHAMAHDPLRNRLVLFGGTDMNGGFPGDTWEWDGTAWTAFAAGGPSPRVWHRMVYDPGRARVLLVGGANNPFVHSDTWEWDGTVWTQLAGNGSFPPRIMPGLVHDTALRRTLLIGGFDGSNAAALNDVHAFDPVTTTWSLVPVAGAPQLEQVVAAVFDALRARTVLLTWDAFTSSRGFAFRSLGTAAASYTPYGQGCAGGLGQTPLLGAAAGTSPARASTFVAEVSAVGNAAAVLLGSGLSRTQWLGATLPLSLAPVGMPGCDVLASFDVTVLLPVAAATRRAQWRWTLPVLRALVGLSFFQQAVTLDPSAGNGTGGVSNGCAGVVQ